MLDNWDYSAWGKVTDHDSLESFLKVESLQDGVHRIPMANGEPLELYVADFESLQHGDKRAPVFFSGALSSREGTSGPYFSGRRMAQRLGTGFLAFSDPTLAEDPQIGLSWYTGVVGSEAQTIMASVCQHLQQIIQSDLIFVGGSGGGFASLVMAEAVPGSMALVWNPQTNLLNYVPTVVKEYLSVVDPTFDIEAANWYDKAENVLADASIRHELNSEPCRSSFFYLQNYNDWHVSKHLAPFLSNANLNHRGRGYYGNSMQGVLVGTFGEGHAVPSSELLDAALQHLLNSNSNAWSCFGELNENGLVDVSRLGELPVNESAYAASIIENATVSVTPGTESTVISCELPTIAAGPHAFQFSVWRGSERVTVSPLQYENQWSETLTDDWDRIHCSIFDGFGQRLGDAVLENGVQRSKSSKVLVYGSCVSRDVFEYPNAPQLQGYFARSSVASALEIQPHSKSNESLENNPSNFQRRMVEADLNKTLSSELRKGEFDYLLVDFIDERFNLSKDEWGNILTISPEFQRCKINVTDDEIIQSGSDEHLARFEEGWARLVSLVDPAKIVINKVVWSAQDDEGNPIGDATSTAYHNRTLQRLYDIVERLSPNVQWIEHPEADFVGKSKHKWGISPFHFVDSNYFTVIEHFNTGQTVPDAAAAVDAKYFVVVETNFCDFEKDPKVRQDYLERWLIAIQQLAKVRVPQNVTLKHLLYISTDKQSERAQVSSLISSFPIDLQNRFMIVDYSHPVEGYPESHGSTHIDIIKNPNKHAPRRDRLFGSVLPYLHWEQYDRLIRIAIDDDDWWMPWQVEEIIRISEAAFESESIVAVGLTQALVAYMADHKVTHAEMNRVLTGNKFFLASSEKASELAVLSPWGLPEVFTENWGENYARQGVVMKCTGDHHAGWVYGRWGKNLTVADKSKYNTEVFGEMVFENQIDLLQRLPDCVRADSLSTIPDLSLQPRELEVYGKRDGKRIWIDSNLKDMNVPRDFVRVFIRDENRNDEIFDFHDDGPWIVESNMENVVIMLYIYKDRKATHGAFTRQRFLK